jgi:glycosyltransferase involved in cell wall biosynthesis
MHLDLPKVSIGVPVFNGEAYLRESLDSIVSQTFTNFEVIISDNASSDKSAEICKEFGDKDNRIKFFQQPENIGGWPNFKFVLKQARGEYFMWSAADDIRSLDFVELNYNFLASNSDYIASTCPNRFGINNKNVSFALKESDEYRRFEIFFDHCWSSHGIFYSLTRTNILRDCSLLNNNPVFFGIDWAVDIFLASKGKINLTEMGYTLFNTDEGESKRADHYKRVRNSKIEIFLPFYELSLFVIKLSKPMNFFKKIKVINILLKLNIEVIYSRLKTKLKNLLIYFNLL